MSEKPVPELQPTESQALVQINWSELTQKTTEFLAYRKQALLTILVALGLLFPHGVTDAQDLDQLVCDIAMSFDAASKNTTITCHTTDGETIEIDLSFYVYNMDVRRYADEQINNPPAETMQYLSDLANPNFNCHSYTLQLLEKRAGVSFGGDRNSWLEAGVDSLVIQFSELVTETDSFEAGFGENVVDPTHIAVGDVVLFYDGSGQLIHSATVREIATDEETGQLQPITANKFGRSQLMAGTIGDVARRYELGGEYDEIEQIGGGRIAVYRPNIEALQAAFANANSPEPSLHTQSSPSDQSSDRNIRD